MRLEQLDIENFRRIEKASLLMASGTNLITGENAQGKTTILEAISYVARGRSFRTRRDRDCLPSAAKNAETVASVDARFEASGGHHLFRAAISSREKALFIDGKPVRRLAEIMGMIPIVTFTPEDLEIVRGAPSERRSFIDGLIATQSRINLQSLQDYAIALKNRNALLREHHPPTAQLESWEQQLATHGARIVLARRELLTALQESVSKHLERLAPDDLPVEVRIDSGFGGEEFSEFHQADALSEKMMKIWNAERRRDCDKGSTGSGPHRADLAMMIAGRDSRQFASQGQARSLALALRLSERDIIAESLTIAPILLLDDVLGELDKRRTAHFVSILADAKTQSILTATDAAAVEGSLPIAARFIVSGGRVERHA